MNKHVLSGSVVVASIVLGLFFFDLGPDWFLAYIIFGGAITMGILAALDGTHRGSSSSAPERRINGSTEPRDCASVSCRASSARGR